MDLHRLARPDSRRIAVRVTAAGLRSVRAGHPWLFSHSVSSVSYEGEPGELAVVFDDRRRFAGIGLWDPEGPIRVRLLATGDPVTIDAAFWRAQVERAAQRRAPLLAAADDVGAVGVRMINGENDGFGGLIVDRYAAVLVVKVYTPAWWPHLGLIVDALRGHIEDALGREPDAVVLRLANSVEPLPADAAGQPLDDGTVLWAAPGITTASLTDVAFEESGLRFGADVLGGQKTGWFLDQRANRRRVAEMAAGADVLDVFCAGGGFTVHAAAAEAHSIVSVDAATPAIAATERNLERNRHLRGVADVRWRGIVGDAFSVLEDLDRERARFDLVIVDPPAFARRRAQVGAAVRAYRRVATQAAGLLRPGGILVQASCSARIGLDEVRSAVELAADHHGRGVQERWTSGHDIDHPVTFPEGEYLCAGAWQLT